MDFKLKLSGVCSTMIEFTLNDDLIVSNVAFTRGCPGNIIGVAKLAAGRHVDDIVPELLGIPCGDRPTSCPDQFAKALLQAKNEILLRKSQ